MPFKPKFEFKKLLPWIILLSGLGATYYFKNLSQQLMMEQLSAKFAAQATNLSAALHKRLEKHMLILHGAASIASRLEDHSGQKEFHDFVSGLSFTNHYPGALGVGFIKRLRPNEVRQHLTKYRQIKGSDYKIWPASHQKERSTTLYIEPQTSRTKSMIGFDMSVAPERQAAMHLARDLNRAAVTGKIKLIREGEKNRQAGFILFYPVYVKNRPFKSIAQRRENLSGWVFTAFRAGEFVNGVLHDFNYDLQVKLYADSRLSPGNLLNHADDYPLSGNAFIGKLDFRRPLPLLGHTWTAHITAPPSYQKNIQTRETEIVQLAGIALSLLLFAYFWNLSRSKDRAESLASEMTKNLRDSEYRWNFAIEGAGDGLTDLDVASGLVFYSPQWKRLLGYAEEVGNTLREWRDRLHPNNYASAQLSLDLLLFGKEPTLTHEHRLKHKDGNYVWFRCRAAVVKRSPDGSASRVIATFSDISTEMENRVRINRLTQIKTALGKTNNAIIHSQTQQELLNEICRIAVTKAGMKMSQIVLLNQEKNILAPAAQYCMPEECPFRRNLALPREPLNQRNPLFKSVMTHQPLWIHDLDAEESMRSWHICDYAERCESMAAMPLFKGTAFIGFWLLFSEDKKTFDEEIQTLLIDIGRNINKALDYYALEEERIQSEFALRESEARYTTLFSKSSLAKLVTDAETGNIIDANYQASLLYGWTVDKLRSMNVKEIHTLPEDIVASKMLKALNQEISRFTFQHRSADGSLVDVEVSSGPVEVDGKKLILSTIHDVTETKKTMQALQKSEVVNSTILNSLAENIALISETGVILTVNQAWLNFSAENGGSARIDDWIGKNYLDACTMATTVDSEDAQFALHGIKEVLAGRKSTFEMEYACDSHWEHRWFHMRVTRLPFQQTGAVISHENITDRKLHEIEILNSRTQLSALTTQLIEAQESERKNIARELHDDLGQRFTSLNIHLHQLLPHLAAPEAKTSFTTISKEMAALIDQMRSISRSLRPPALDYFGLEISLNNLLKQHFMGTDISHEMEYVGLPKKLPEKLEITLYRIIQESINNILRHAQASHVMIEVNGSHESGEIELIIRDDGIGFDASNIRPPEHGNSGFGLIGMLERAKLLGGKVNISSSSGTGTRIHVLLPLK